MSTRRPESPIFIVRLRAGSRVDAIRALRAASISSRVGSDRIRVASAMADLRGLG